LLVDVFSREGKYLDNFDLPLLGVSTDKSLMTGVWLLSSATPGRFYQKLLLAAETFTEYVS
jgi:hypothetical protein